MTGAQELARLAADHNDAPTEVGLLRSIAYAVTAIALHVTSTEQPASREDVTGLAAQVGELGAQVDMLYVRTFGQLSPRAERDDDELEALP